MAQRPSTPNGRTSYQPEQKPVLRGSWVINPSTGARDRRDRPQAVSTKVNVTKQGNTSKERFMHHLRLMKGQVQVVALRCKELQKKLRELEDNMGKTDKPKGVLHEVIDALSASQQDLNRGAVEHVTDKIVDIICNWETLLPEDSKEPTINAPERKEEVQKIAINRKKSASKNVIQAKPVVVASSSSRAACRTASPNEKQVDQQARNDLPANDSSQSITELDADRGKRKVWMSQPRRNSVKTIPPQAADLHDEACSRSQDIRDAPMYSRSQSVFSPAGSTCSPGSNFSPASCGSDDKTQVIQAQRHASPNSVRKSNAGCVSTSGGKSKVHFESNAQNVQAKPESSSRSVRTRVMPRRVVVGSKEDELVEVSSLKTAKQQRRTVTVASTGLFIHQEALAHETDVSIEVEENGFSDNENPSVQVGNSRVSRRRTVTVGGDGKYVFNDSKGCETKSKKVSNLGVFTTRPSESRIGGEKGSCVNSKKKDSRRSGVVRKKSKKSSVDEAELYIPDVADDAISEPKAVEYPPLTCSIEGEDFDGDFLYPVLDGEPTSPVRSAAPPLVDHCVLSSLGSQIELQDGELAKSSLFELETLVGQDPALIDGIIEEMRHFNIASGTNLDTALRTIAASIVMVASGTLCTVDSAGCLNRLTRGAIITGKKLISARAETPVVISVLDASKFSKIVDQQAAPLKALRKAIAFCTLKSSDRRLFVAQLKAVEFAPGETIIHEGDYAADKAYIIESGRLNILDAGGELVRQIGAGDYVGERSFLSTVQPTRRTCTVTVAERCSLWQLSPEAFNRFVTGPIRKHMEDRVQFQDLRKEVNMKDWSSKMRLASGACGKVNMVVNKKTGRRLALKCMAIQSIVARGETTGGKHSLLREKQILEECDHPFIIKLVTPLRSRQYVYLLMELVTGGDLWTYSSQRGTLNPDEIRFYSASTFLALEYLHDRKIAFLDIKGENILIDEHGFIKLVDFGIAQRIEIGKLYELQGTPFYTAPEVMMEDGYTTTADLWSVGVCMYDWAVGDFPFGFNAEVPDIKILKQNILQNKLTFPPSVSDQDCKMAITNLLQRIPELRLGAGENGYANIKSHPFWESLNWDALLSRQIKPPWRPSAEVYDEGAKINPAVCQDVGGNSWEEVVIRGLTGKSSVANGNYRLNPDYFNRRMSFSQKGFHLYFSVESENAPARWVLNTSLGGPDSEVWVETTKGKTSVSPPRSGWTPRDCLRSKRPNVHVYVDKDTAWLQQYGDPADMVNY